MRDAVVGQYKHVGMALLSSSTQPSAQHRLGQVLSDAHHPQPKEPCLLPTNPTPPSELAEATTLEAQ